MPSLFSKFRHRKSASSSSAGDPDSPSSPVVSQNAPASPTSPSQSRQQRLISSSAPITDRSVEDVVVIDQVPSARQQGQFNDTSIPEPVSARPAPYQSEEDSTGHSPVFADQSQRPDLPTTSSNVNNPAPISSSAASKTLPKLPELPQDLSTPFTGFNLPPGAAPAASPSPPPMPHVTSVDRSRFVDTEKERPKPIVSASHGVPEEDEGEVGGRFRHARSIPAPMGPRDSGETPRSRKSTDSKGIPARGVSLAANPPLASAGSSRPITPPSATSVGPRESLKSVWDPDTNGDHHIGRHIENLSLNQQTHIDYQPISTPALEAARNETVAAIASSTGESRNTLSQFGQGVFHAAGLGYKVGMANTVDVRTKWIEPVVQETVRRTEHTDTLLVVDRDIHKYHIYPKIQPVHDPNPIQLETRHRIFSQADNQWHEVVGDAAAIEILGEEAFYRGQKQTRETRGMVLPGLGGEMKSMTEEEMLANGLGTGFGMGRVLEREGPLGGPMGEWREVSRRRMNVNGTRGSANPIRESRVGLAL